MPNKKRSAKLRDKKLIQSGANFKDEHVKSLLKELIKKSRVEDDDYEEDERNLEDVTQSKDEEEGVVDLAEKVEIAAPVPKRKATTTGEKITKKNKKNKYFLIAHPDMKEKVKNDNHGFVVNKDIVKKKFLVEKSETNRKSNNGVDEYKELSKIDTSVDDATATLWKIEPCTDDDDDNEKEEKNGLKKKKNKKKRKLGEIKEVKDLKFETKREVLEDGTIVETYCAVNEEEKEVVASKEDDEEHVEKSVKKKKGNQIKSENGEKNKFEKDDKPAVELGEAEKKLQSSRFRYLNELLYTKKSEEAFTYFKSDKDAFKAYHQGFQSQTTKWPVNPLETIIKAIKSK